MLPSLFLCLINCCSAEPDGRAWGALPHWRRLRSNFHHFLRNIGVKDGSGIGEFLLGRSLAGYTTYDSYCTMTSPEAQNHLLNLLNRDKSQEPLLSIEETVTMERTDGGKERVIVRAREPWRFTQATATVRLEPGQSLEITSSGMINGVATARAVK